ncbi:MAG: plastocyanin/azurin family copper-binding protein [Planctomycetota bacterium]|nr:plastocyanin/azurin family copper-binding protein [Planctomycetota bacterium]
MQAQDHCFSVAPSNRSIASIPMRVARKNIPRLVAGSVRIQLVLNSYTFSYGSYYSAARLARVWAWPLLLALAGQVFTDTAIGQQTAAPDDKPFSQETVDALVSRSSEQGDFSRGLRVFTQAKSACFSCHRIGETGGAIGPELSRICKERTPAQLAESLLWPNRKIEPEFQPVKVQTKDGELIGGYVVTAESSDSVLALRDPATQKITKVEREEIESQANGLSLMPNGLIESLSQGDQADLLHFLVALGQGKDLDLPSIEATIRTANTHEPASFPLVRDPIHPELKPSWKQNVNRNRIYDFYSKQAAYFTEQAKRPEWLSSFPGLDGESFGHWGNQNEEYWKGDEWNSVVHGLVQCGVFRAGDKTIARAVCFRMGSGRSWSACFNPDTMTYEKLWSGGFVGYSSVRHGFMDGMRIVGKESVLPNEAKSIRELRPELAKANIEYQGYFVHQDNILFLYKADGVEYIDAPTMNGSQFKRIVAPRSTHPLRQLLSGGPKQWPFVFDTNIVLGNGKGFAVDTIEVPKNNPWKIPVACGDHAFLKDGTGIVATMHGDIWRVEGISFDAKQLTQPANPKSPVPKARWKRIASGLNQALGVWVHEDEIYVLGRNQITRLHDLNSDFEIDWYECFSNAFESSPGGHDYICGMQRDKFGNFYIASGNQGILQISPDGKKVTVIATGFRNPDGIGLLPDGTVTVPNSEGDWAPTSMIALVSPKPSAGNDRFEFESSPPPFFGHRGPKEGQAVELPLVYLPRGLDNSSGGQVWVDDARMGPLNGQMLHTSYGAGAAMMVLRDQVGDRWQGAVVPLPGEYRSGVHRAHLSPSDGQVYLTGMNGWGSYTTDPGCFQRLRFTGEDIQLPIGFHVHANGVAVRFRKPIDAELAKDTAKHFAQCWNYRYSPGYGSKEYSVLHTPMIGHDCLTIASSHVLDEGKTLFLEIPDLQLCSQLHLRMAVGTGTEPQELFATVNAMDSDRIDLPNYQSRPGKVLLQHPMVRDLEWLKRSVPNPWRNRIAEARAVRIESRDNLQFSTRTVEATAGETIKLTFGNPDVVPHNWALIRPGTLQKIGDLTNRLVNDPDAFLRHYVPESSDVICYTDVVEPKGEGAIYFQVPSEPGRYPYLCTFPGHWMVMNGELIVKPAK